MFKNVVLLEKIELLIMSVVLTLLIMPSKMIKTNHITNEKLFYINFADVFIKVVIIIILLFVIEKVHYEIKNYIKKMYEISKNILFLSFTFIFIVFMFVTHKPFKTNVINVKSEHVYVIKNNTLLTKKLTIIDARQQLSCDVDRGFCLTFTNLLYWKDNTLVSSHYKWSYPDQLINSYIEIGPYETIYIYLIETSSKRFNDNFDLKLEGNINVKVFTSEDFNFEKVNSLGLNPLFNHNIVKRFETIFASSY